MAITTKTVAIPEPRVGFIYPEYIDPFNKFVRYRFYDIDVAVLLLPIYHFSDTTFTTTTPYQKDGE